MSTDQLPFIEASEVRKLAVMHTDAEIQAIMPWVTTANILEALGPHGAPVRPKSAYASYTKPPGP